jgi:hypothetical protein
MDAKTAAQMQADVVSQSVSAITAAVCLIVESLDARGQVDKAELAESLTKLAGQVDEEAGGPIFEMVLQGMADGILNGIRKT